LSETTVRRRRPRGEDAIYFAADKNRYVGSVSLGYGPDGKRIRRKVFGKTKQEVRDRLKALHKEMDAGVKSSKTHTVRETVEDWLREGLDGTSERTLLDMLQEAGADEQVTALASRCLGRECLSYSADKGTPRISSGLAGKPMAARPNHGTGAIWIDVARLNGGGRGRRHRPQRRPSGRARLCGCRWPRCSRGPRCSPDHNSSRGVIRNVWVVLDAKAQPNARTDGRC
jgi:hypothetical protein